MKYSRTWSKRKVTARFVRYSRRSLYYNQVRYNRGFTGGTFNTNKDHQWYAEEKGLRTPFGRRSGWFCRVERINCYSDSVICFTFFTWLHSPSLPYSGSLTLTLFISLSNTHTHTHILSFLPWIYSESTICFRNVSRIFIFSWVSYWKFIPINKFIKIYFLTMDFEVFFFKKISIQNNKLVLKFVNLKNTE